MHHLASDAAARSLAVLPLGVRSENGDCTANFLGGQQATFNMPLYAKDFAAAAGEADIEQLLDLLRTQPDLLALARQPLRWLDMTNPLSLPSQPSVNGCPLLKLVPDARPAERISNSFRRRLKGKQRKLQGALGYRYLLAQTDDEIKRLLDTFFIIKPQRIANQKLPNVFADPGIRDFIFAACSARLRDGRAIEIHALEFDSEVIAILAGVADGHRFPMTFNTSAISGNPKFSPGLILLRNIIDYYPDRH